MRRRKNALGRKNEQGFIITLVAVFLLGVVGAMAALSIDLVTIYTARSEAQLAADSAALAAARVLANSGATSDTTGASMSSAWTVAQAVALQVAEQNTVGGVTLTSAQVTIPANPGGTNSNPTFTIKVQITNLPTFFARIWGTKFVTVGASATAEAYNPSESSALVGASTTPVAPICVKPWLLPNIDPTGTITGANKEIFSPRSGRIRHATLLGKGWPYPTGNPNGLYADCGDCSPGVVGPNLPAPAAGEYYPGAIDAADFPAPTQALPACSSGFSTNGYQLAVAGCVQQPISCGATAQVNIDVTPYTPTNAVGGRDADTVQAAECLIHYVSAAGDSDSIDINYASSPFQFLAGIQNPIASAVGKDVMVSDSLVTIPVIDYPGGSSTPTTANPTVTVIGFLQVFLNPQSAALPLPSPPAPQIPATIINMAGCGTNANGQPILGNGASPVAVRLISQ